MTEAATWELCVDLNRDRDFADANEDISAYWKSMKVKLGASAPGQFIARAATLDVVLDNSDGLFSPEHGSALSGFLPGALVRLRSTYSATTRQHFIGWIDPDGIQPAPGSKLERETTMTASGYFARLLNEEVRVAVQEDKTIDLIVSAILGATNIYPPAMTGWLLGMYGFSELGEATLLISGLSDYTTMETGIHTFAHAGDNWYKGVTIHQALRDLIETERGFLFVDRDGYLILWNRHHFYSDLQNAVDVTFTESDILHGELGYQYGSRLINYSRVTTRIREVAGSASVLGTIEDSFSIPKQSTQTVTVRFKDSSTDQEVGGKDLITPVANVDYTAHTQSDGTGTDVTANITVSVVEYGTSAEITYASNYPAQVWIDSGATIRGTKITDFGTVEAVYDDGDSIRAYGRSDMSADLPLLNDVDWINQYARWVVHRDKDPRGVVEKVTFMAGKTSTLMGYALANTIGDRIALSESQVGVSGGEYYIVGEEHTIRHQNHHTCTWILEEAPYAVWMLGITDYSELGETTFLGL